MTAVLLDPTTPVPTIPDGMTVQVVYTGQYLIHWAWDDTAGRRVHCEWFDDDTQDWTLTPKISTTPFEWEDGTPKCCYDGVHYRLEVGNDRCWMPIEAARLWFGDERSRERMGDELTRKGTVSWINDRATERRRLRCLYDNRMGSESTILGHPVVEVYTVDGLRVPMVLDDPSGKMSSPSTATVATQEQMLDQLRAATDRIAQLERQMGLDNGTSTPRRGRAPRPEPRIDGEAPAASAQHVDLSQLPEDQGT